MCRKTRLRRQRRHKAKIVRRGQYVTREYGIDPFELTRTAEIMVHEMATLRADLKVGETVAFFSDSGHSHRVYPVLDEDSILVGVIERADALRWREKKTDFDQISLT